MPFSGRCTKTTVQAKTGPTGVGGPGEVGGVFLLVVVPPNEAMDSEG